MSRNISFKDLQIGTTVLIKNETKWRTIKNRQYAPNKTTLILWFDNDNWEYARNVYKVLAPQDKNLDVFTKNEKDSKQENCTLISIDKEYETNNGFGVKLFEYFNEIWYGRVEKCKDVWVNATWDKHGYCLSTYSDEYNLQEKSNFKFQSIKPLRITKGIPYFGYNLVVPDNTKYVATNKSGWIYAYPIAIAVDDDTCFDVVDETKKIYEIGTCVGYLKNYSGDWKNSLVKL